MNPLSRMVKKAEDLLRRIRIETAKNRQTSGIPIETYKNYCLTYADRINRLRGIPQWKKAEAREKVFKVYFDLQDFKGAERQTLKPNVEIPFSSLPGNITRYLVSADSYQGGLGFSVARGLFLQDSHQQSNPYWKPPQRRSPVYSVPKSEYARLIEEYYWKRKLTIEEWIEDFERERQEHLYEMRQLRIPGYPDNKRLLIM